MPLTNRARAAWAAACVIGITTACNDVPLLPQWDADWNLPLPSSAQALPVAVIPNNTPAVAVSSPVDTQSLANSIGQLLKQDLSNASVIVTLSKTVNLSGTDTLFVASSQANLTNAGDPTRIVVPLSYTSADRTLVDTVAVTAAGLSMLQSVATNEGNIFLQMRGSVQNNSGATVTTTTADSLRVKLALVATIGVSR